MNAHSLSQPQPARPPDADAVRRQAANTVFQRLAFASFAIWTLGCLALFILFAAGNPRPVPSAVAAMILPLVPALAIWLFYRPIVRWQAARGAAARPSGPRGARTP